MGLTKSRNIQQETFNSIEERLRKGPERESMNEIAKMFKVSKPVVLELNKKLGIRTKKVGKRLLRT